MTSHTSLFFPGKPDSLEYLLKSSESVPGGPCRPASSPEPDALLTDVPQVSWDSSTSLPSPL